LSAPLARTLRDYPIRRKLRTITIIAAGAALVLACGAFVAYDLVTFPATMVQQLATQADIMARQSTAPLVFMDPDSARTTLEALSADPHVRSAAIYTPDGASFASYLRPGEQAVVSRPDGGQRAGHLLSSDRLVLFRAIELDGAVVGTVVIESDLAAVTARLQRYGIIALAVLLVSFLVAHWTASRLEAVITGPIQHLAATADAVSSHRDYSVRATVQGRDELGQLTLVFNHMLDEIQARDLAQHASEEKYRLLFEANPNPMWLYDPDTLIFLGVNEAAVRLYGYSSDEFLAMTTAQIRPPEAAPAASEGLPEPSGDGSRSNGPTRHRRKDGSILEVLIASSAFTFGESIVRLVMVTDVSEKKKLESQLIQAQKMEAVGRLAGGVAHDFNNLLGVITGYSELLGKNLPADGPGRGRLDQIKAAASRAAALTRQLLAFSRKEVVQPRVLDLNEVVADIETMLHRLIGEDVRLVTKLGKDLGRVEADRGQIDQIIMNLAVNARDAMPDGGDLWIETSNAELDEAYLRTHADVRPGHYVLLAVSDSGHGMDSETLAHVFEPFFTTKPEGKGTGLGLATVFGIAKQSGGHVNVYSEPGKGTTFKVYLPRADRHAPLLPARAPSGPLPRGTETILLVEDAEALRQMIQEVLEGAGYAVLESADPADAALRAAKYEGALDLVLTDVVMPGMSGPDLVRAVQGTRPAVKVLFMSGYTNDAIGRQGVIGPDLHFLQKPFTFEALLGSVRAALDHERSA
jgi:two-component system, cell cycle sensor histidine kinase and response regulator CckA